MRMDYRRSATGRLICLCCVLLLLFSFALVLIEAGHACTGDDCPVCALLRSVLQRGENGLPAAGGVLLFGFCLFYAAVLLLKHCRRDKTPALKKIRMNN